MKYLLIAAILGFTPQVAEVISLLTGWDDLMLATGFLALSALFLAKLRRPYARTA